MSSVSIHHFFLLSFTCNTKFNAKNLMVAAWFYYKFQDHDLQGVELDIVWHQDLQGIEHDLQGIELDIVWHTNVSLCNLKHWKTCQCLIVRFFVVPKLAGFWFLMVNLHYIQVANGSPIFSIHSRKKERKKDILTSFKRPKWPIRPNKRLHLKCFLVFENKSK